jgi:hypothetical protein
MSKSKDTEKQTIQSRTVDSKREGRTLIRPLNFNKFSSTHYFSVFFFTKFSLIIRTLFYIFHTSSSFQVCISKEIFIFSFRIMYIIKDDLPTWIVPFESLIIRSDCVSIAQLLFIYEDCEFHYVVCILLR